MRSSLQNSYSYSSIDKASFSFKFFQVFTLSLVFQNFNMIYIMQYILLKSSQPLLLQIFILPCSFSSFSCSNFVHLLILSRTSQKCYLACFQFNFAFFLCISVWEVSIELFSSSLIISSAMWNLINLSKAFVCYFFLIFQHFLLVCSYSFHLSAGIIYLALHVI